MSDEKALLAAIWEHPHEDTPRLVYADWLQENGQPERAEFIRVQCEMWQIDPWDERMDDLRRRATAARGSLPGRWREGLPPGAVAGFERGFPVIDLSEIGTSALLALKPKDLRAAPLSRFPNELSSRDLDSFLKWPGAAVQDVLCVNTLQASGWIDHLTRCARLRNVSDLRLVGRALAPGDLRAILDAWADRHLLKLCVGCPIGEVGATVLTGRAALGRVRELNLSGSGLTATGIKALGRSPHLGRLRDFDASHNPLGDAGATALAGSPLLSVRNLNLGHTEMGDAGAAALAGSPRAAGLRWLVLGRNRIGPEGLRTLARSPHLSGLKYLNVCRNPGVGDAAAELRDRFGAVVATD
jgi:uncharacterized protein (TIGR02996 family)